jgi:Leucine-rich repeat (LRR) protein
MSTCRLGVLVALIFVTASPLSGAIPQSERDALVAFYNSTNGASWVNNTGWLGAAGTECDWFGVDCDETQSNVVRIDLAFNGLTGELPQEIGNLTKLGALALWDNQIGGTLPESITTLDNLWFIEITFSQITGPLPASISNLQSLVFMRLHDNRFTGEIPPNIGQLTNLEELYLGGNQFTGTIPDSIGSLTKLRAFGVNNNDLTGPLPESIGNLTELEGIGLSYNRLSGRLPESISNLKKLANFNIDFNDFEGPLPSGFGDLTELVHVALLNNRLSGPLPSFAKLKKLWLFRAELNRFEGNIPADIGDATSLVWLDLWSNRLTGPIPDSIGNLPNIEVLGLSENRLSGSIPTSIGNLTTLKALSLESNALTGEIPAGVWALPNVEAIHVQANQLSGTIPPEVKNLPKLQSLSVHSNLMTGTIPKEIGEIPSLTRFLIFGNAVRGEIPASIANLTNLFELRLEDNALTASDPALIEFVTNHPSEYVGAFNFVHQTVAPSDVKVESTGSYTATLSWKPIDYTWEPGGYQIHVSTSPGGQGTPVLTTNDKWADRAVVTGLQPSTSYYFRVVTVTYPHGGRPDYQLNTVFSDPSAEVSATTLPPSSSPAEVLVTAFPRGLFQAPGAGGATDGYTLTNIGGEATTITLTQNGTFFQQEPSMFTLEPGASQPVALTGISSAEGEYHGASVPSGAGVAPGTEVGVYLLSSPSQSQDFQIVAAQNRLDLIAPEGSNPSGSLVFRNVGTGAFTGVAASDVQFLSAQQGLITIPAGGEVSVSVSADRALRPDAELLSGTQVGRVSLSGIAGFDAKGRVILTGGTTPSLVTVADTVKPATDDGTIPPLGENEVALFLTSVGHVVGSVGEFLSDVSILNASGTSPVSDLKLYYTPLVADAKTKVATLNTLGTSQAVGLADAVKSVFDGDAEIGTMQVRSARAASLSASANIFNASNPAGNYGTSIPVFRSDRSAGPDATVLLTGLRKDATGHTNLFVQETGGAPVSFAVEFLASDGTVIGAAGGNVEAFGMTRLVDPLTPGAVAAKIRNNGGGGAIAAYATPVDRASGDTWAVSDWSLHFGYDAAETVVIPVAGAVRGANDTFFRTDLAITNRCDEPVVDAALYAGTPCRLSSSEAMLRYYPTTGGVIEKQVELGLLETAVMDDVVRETFGIETDTIGHIELVPTTGAFAVTSRTYTTTPDSPATFGSAVPAIGRSLSIRPGQSMRIGALSDTTKRTVGARTPATSRTNFGIVETSGKPVTVNVSVYYNDPRSLASGKPLGTKAYQLGANQFVSVSSLVESIVGPARETLYGDLTDVQVQFDVVSAEGAIVVYTSSVDNGTGDSILRME